MPAQPLASRQRCWWKVRVWDEEGRVSAYSAPGLLGNGAAAGRGLAGAVDRRAHRAQRGCHSPARARIFGKPSPSNNRCTAARVFISGLGYHELYINGKKVGDHVLDPAFTRYDVRTLYVAHDVTELLH